MEKPKSNKNEIRVTKIKNLTNYLTYIYHLFTDEVKFEFVTINAIGNAIAKAVALAELCRLRIAGLYTTIDITFVELPDEDSTKRVTCIKITLSKKQLEKTHTGYMEPLPLDKVQEYKVLPPREHDHEEGETRGEYRRERRPARRRGYRACLLYTSPSPRDS